MSVNAHACLTFFALVLLSACGGMTDPEDESSGGTASSGTGGVPSGGSTGGGGTSAGGTPSGGAPGGGAAGAPGSGGSGATQCELVGCSAPPLCSTGCQAECGCCPCAEGEAVDLEGVKHECIGGCWAPVGAACTYQGQLHDAGAVFPADDGCNTCECMANGTVMCTLMACPSCDPAREEHRREYVALSPGECALIDYDCAGTTLPFSNDCGCGCEQAPSCPEWLNCMPGDADPECGDLDAFAIRCPFSGVAW